MSLTGSIIIYVLIWWIVFFSLLPVDVDRNKKNFVEGVDPGAPENPRLIKKLTYTTIDVYRDLHCWEMLFNWIPLGYHQSYTLTIRVKASELRDLKYERKKDWFTPEYN